MLHLFCFSIIRPPLKSKLLLLCRMTGKKIVTVMQQSKLQQNSKGFCYDGPKKGHNSKKRARGLIVGIKNNIFKLFRTRSSVNSIQFKAIHPKLFQFQIASKFRELELHCSEFLVLFRVFCFIVLTEKRGYSQRTVLS